MYGLLEGTRVVDLGALGPGARATRWLADYGADVVRIERPLARRGGQMNFPWHAYGAGRGIRRIRVDVKTAPGRDVYLRLAASADVIVEAFRPGVADRLGVGYEATRVANPSIVYCAATGYGQTGPYAHWAGHDINYVAVGGLLGQGQRRADGGPPVPGATVADSGAGGMHAALAIVASLLSRERTGSGRYLDVSAVDGVVGLLAVQIDEELVPDADAGPIRLLFGDFACYNLYRCRDDRWLSVGALEPRFWQKLCEVLGLDHLVGLQLDDERQAKVIAEVAQVIATRDRDDWVAELGPRHTCVAPVNTLDEIATDVHLAARHVIVDADHQTHGRFRQVGNVLAGCEPITEPPQLRDPLVTNTDDLLADVGFTTAEIADLRAEGIVE